LKRTAAGRLIRAAVRCGGFSWEAVAPAIGQTPASDTLRAHDIRSAKGSKTDPSDPGARI